MLFCITAVSLSALYLIISGIVTTLHHNHNFCFDRKAYKKLLGFENVSDQELTKEQIEAIEKARYEAHEAYEKVEDRLRALRSVFDYDTDMFLFWASWICMIILGLWLVLGVNIDRSDCLKTMARCDVIEKQIEDGYVYESQESLMKLQKTWAENKTFAENFPFWTFYTKGLVNKTYDRVMSLKVPELENTREYILTINKNVELKTVTTDK